VADAPEAPAAHLYLREHTRHAHEATEASDGMHRLMAGELDEAGYDALLRSQESLYRAWETEHAAWLAGSLASAGWQYTSRAALIAADLMDRLPASQAQQTAPSPTPTPTSTTPSSTADDACRWGELYVIEGSSLGGRLIARRLRELYPQRAHHFYAVGENAPSSWRRFQALLDTHLTDDAARRSAMDGALRMFARFRQALKDPPGHV
jgi:heme oxygenase